MQQSSTVTRYLIFFQYLGTKYSGVMKAPAHQPLQGVQNHLENAVRRLKPVNEVSVSISSRTDTGVHALCNSAHLDIQRRGDKPPFTERVLTDALNFFLKPEPIRITRVYCVRSDFHARYRAISRTYVYRLATGVCHHTQLPITEKDLCWTLWDTDIQFWELQFKSRSFLYKQVRRMVGALVAVGRGKLSVSQVQDLLDTRDSMAYPQNMAAPPYGLFLINVEYNDSDLKPYRGDID
ncbi:tRNA pseudouridine synthase-like 1 isoform X3 [Pangasianodon hypophthalmus]|uniref:tRNA pseudouridine synthase-like 1 isoform X3 n=1 Tax=Pangasianodon hypophthalmus TaxID=310915 RepID=UPI00147C1211|nr:tRNA pseudouridine synthase-like 1 isoform X3 [Pangasianodon hypophthalmus]